ncbi:MAG: hypothetical protein LLF28_03190 [Nitrospiraceae bacterium]|nr:hypothetical protein [Nitrospiraceae bacterium]
MDFKRYFYICSISILTGLCFAVTSHAYGNNEPAKTENVKPADFSKQPVAAMKEIYKNYHDWKVDQGIASAKKAIEVVNKIYEKDINGKINDPNLKKNRAFEIKSTLHTLLGMLYYRKSLMVASENKKSLAPIFDKLNKKQEVTDKELEQVAANLKTDKTSVDSRKYADSSKEEFLTAIKTDPSNPTPHFQLANILSPLGTGGQGAAEAEKEYFLAAKLSMDEGDEKSVKRAFDAIKSLNPKSSYLKQIEKLKKEKKGAA